MEKIKNHILLRDLFILLLIIAPFIKCQIITGSLVNASLFFAVYFLGFNKTLPLTFIPCLIALSNGLLPFISLVPFIIFSNLLLITLFEKYKDNLLNAVMIAAIGKGLFFYMILFMFPFCSYLFSLTQLMTAALGGIIFLKGKNYLKFTKD